MTIPPVGASGSSTTGLAPNVAGALAYVLGPLTGVILLVIEKDSPFVRFHAAQAVVVGVAVLVLSILLSIVSAILTVIPFLGPVVSALIGFAFTIATFVLWVLLMWKAFNGEEWNVPGTGDYARRIGRL